jgi:predicted glutamine amidotransferase
MNTEIENLVAHVRQATDYQTNKIMLREKMQTDLHFTHNGGLFKITPELLAFVATWPVDELYLEDTYQNPIQIDRSVFLVTAQQHYQKVMNTWHQQHDELKKIRKV